MLQNNKGFFLLELLLSLSALLMISLFLLPSLIHLKEQSRQLSIESRARQFMYEELQAALMNSQSMSNTTIQENGVEYKIIWPAAEMSGQKEVCVRVEQNSLQSGTEICGVLE